MERTNQTPSTFDFDDTPDTLTAPMPYEKPALQAHGQLHQLVRGSSAKGVDSCGELDLENYPF